MKYTPAFLRQRAAANRAKRADLEARALALFTPGRALYSVEVATATGAEVSLAIGALARLQDDGKLESARGVSPISGTGRRYYWLAGTPCPACVFQAQPADPKPQPKCKAVKRDWGKRRGHEQFAALTDLSTRRREERSDVERRVLAYFTGDTRASKAEIMTRFRLSEHVAFDLLNRFVREGHLVVTAGVVRGRRYFTRAERSREARTA